MRSGLRIATLFVRSGSEALLAPGASPETAFADPAFAETEVLELPADIFASAVTTESPQGIAALVEAPRFTLTDVLGADALGTDALRANAQANSNIDARTLPLVVIAAGLQDPGNLGTLVRSAEAFGATGVVTLPGTVSLWNAKALRASSGSAFRLPVVAASEAEAFAALSGRGIRVYAAVAAQGEEAPSCHLHHAVALMIGNEGSGLSRALLAQADARITIPCPGPVESLNAAIAASVLLYEASRQRGATHPKVEMHTIYETPAGGA